jgi:hypothetical protein
VGNAPRGIDDDTVKPGAAEGFLPWKAIHQNAIPKMRFPACRNELRSFE